MSTNAKCLAGVERESYNSRKRKSRIVKDSNTHTMFIRK